MLWNKDCAGQAKGQSYPAMIPLLLQGPVQEALQKGPFAGPRKQRKAEGHTMLSSNDSYYLLVLAKATIFFLSPIIVSLLPSLLRSAFLPQLEELAAPSLNVTFSLSKGAIKHSSPATLQSQKHWSSLHT